MFDDTPVEVEKKDIIKMEFESDALYDGLYEVLKGELKFKFKFLTVFSVTAFGTIFSSKMSLENRFKFEIWF